MLYFESSNWTGNCHVLFETRGNVASGYCRRNIEAGWSGNSQNNNESLAISLCVAETRRRVIFVEYFQE